MVDQEAPPEREEQGESVPAPAEEGSSGELPPRVPAAIRDVSFPTGRGYERQAVDAYVNQVNRLIAELEVSRSPQAAVRHALDRVGQQTKALLEQARETAEGDERAATLMAENLRVKAAREPGAEGTRGARAVADAIELRLIEETADPITLGGDEAEAVFYAPEIPFGGGDRLSALRQAVERLHDEWNR